MNNRFRSLIILALALLLMLSGGCLSDGCRDDGIIVQPPIPVYTAKAAPAWSPDGQSIAFAWHGNPILLPRGLYFVNPDGSDLRQLFSFGDFVAIINVCWAPDGEWLAFTTAGWNVYKIKANGDSLTQLTFTDDTPTCSWSYSDTLIAFERIGDDSPGIWLMDTCGNNKRHFIRYGGHLDFAPGDSLFYITFLAWDHLDSSRMNFLNISDSTERMICKWEKGKPYTCYYDPDVSHDGKTIAFSIDDRIRTVSSDGGEIITLTGKEAENPSWSPDDQYIVYCRPDSLGGALRIMRADGTEDRVLLCFDDIPKRGHHE
jgi:Tol biopolymer transport system component